MTNSSGVNLLSLYASLLLSLALGTAGCSVGSSFSLENATSSDEIELQAAGFSVIEGDTKSTTLKLTSASTEAITINWELSGSDVSDTFATKSGSVTIPAGSTLATLTIATTENTIYESDKTFKLSLSSDSSDVENSLLLDVVVTEDDSAPVLSFSTASQSANESAGTVTVGVGMTSALKQNVIVSYTVSGTASNGSDYTLTNGTVTIPALSTSASISVPVTNDTSIESSETIIITLGTISHTSVTLGSTSAHTITIVDDDAPSLSINNITATEGGALVFTVTLSTASTSTETVDWATANNTALSASDYTAASGTLTFAAGETSKTITVNSTNDATICEGNETFKVQLSNVSSGAVIGVSEGTGTIQDNDNPTVSVANVSGTEGNTINVVASLSATCASHNVTFSWVTADQTATSPADYTAVSSTTATITAGQTSVNLPVSTVQDTTDEVDQTLTVTISSPSGATISTASATVTIQDDDSAPTASIDSPSATEGSNLVYTVTLSAASEKTITVAYASSNGTAASSDYTSASGTLTFSAGDTSKTITVATTNDTFDEANETVTMTLSSPSNVTLSTATGTGTINDNDSAPVLAITAPSTNINASNASAYTVSGTCVRLEDGSTITLKVGTTTVGTATCTSEAFSSSTVNVSSIADGTITITANATDAASQAITASQSFTKNTTVQLPFSSVMMSANESRSFTATMGYNNTYSFSLSGLGSISSTADTVTYTAPAYSLEAAGSGTITVTDGASATNQMSIAVKAFYKPFEIANPVHNNQYYSTGNLIYNSADSTLLSVFAAGGNSPVGPVWMGSNQLASYSGGTGTLITPSSGFIPTNVALSPSGVYWGIGQTTTGFEVRYLNSGTWTLSYTYTTSNTVSLASAATRIYFLGTNVYVVYYDYNSSSKRVYAIKVYNGTSWSTMTSSTYTPTASSWEANEVCYFNSTSDIACLYYAYYTGGIRWILRYWNGTAWTATAQKTVNFYPKALFKNSSTSEFMAVGNASSSTLDIYKWDTATSNWTSHKSISENASFGLTNGGQLVYLSSDEFILGGNQFVSATSHINKIYKYTMSTNSWSTIMSVDVGSDNHFMYDVTKVGSNYYFTSQCTVGSYYEHCLMMWDGSAISQVGHVQVDTNYGIPFTAATIDKNGVMYTGGQKMAYNVSYTAKNNVTYKKPVSSAATEILTESTPGSAYSGLNLSTSLIYHEYDDKIYKAGPIWDDSDANTWVIKTYDGTSWTSEDTTTNVDPGTATTASYDLLSLGNDVYAVGTINKYWTVKKKTSGTWSSVRSQQLASGKMSVARYIQADSDGNIFVAGVQIDSNDETHVIVERFSSGTWTEIINYTAYTSAHLAGFAVTLTGDAYVYVASDISWDGFDRADIVKWKRSDASTSTFFSATDVLPILPYNIDYLAISGIGANNQLAVDEYGSIYMIDLSDTSVFRLRKWNTENWSTLETQAASSDYLALATFTHLAQTADRKKVILCGMGGTAYPSPLNATGYCRVQK